MDGWLLLISLPTAVISAETAVPVLALACSLRGCLATEVCLWQVGTRCSWSVCVLSKPLYPIYLQWLWLALPYGGTPSRFRSLCPDKHQTTLTPAMPALLLTRPVVYSLPFAQYGLSNFFLTPSSTPADAHACSDLSSNLQLIFRRLSACILTF